MRKTTFQTCYNGLLRDKIILFKDFRGFSLPHLSCIKQMKDSKLVNFSRAEAQYPERQVSLSYSALTCRNRGKNNQTPKVY